MADEITVQVQLNSLLTRDSRAHFVDTFTQAAAGKDGGYRTIGTSEEDITFTDITTPGFCLIVNEDPTNNVRLGPKSAGVLVRFIELKPGEPALFPIDSSAVIRAVALVATCRISIFVLER